jgi:hypothetical protein
MELNHEAKFSKENQKVYITNSTTSVSKSKFIHEETKTSTFEANDSLTKDSNQSPLKKFHTSFQDKQRSSSFIEKPKIASSLSIFTVTWNLNGKSASPKEINALLPEKKYDIYAIGSEECMRSIFKSFFFSDKKHWENMIM